MTNKDKNTSQKARLAKDFFSQNGGVLGHLEAYDVWCRESLTKLGWEADDSYLFGRFYGWQDGNRIHKDAQKIHSAMEHAVRDISQALVWHHDPAHSSWDKPIISRPVDEKLFDDKYKENADVEPVFTFTKNLHYSKPKLQSGWLSRIGLEDNGRSNTAVFNTRTSIFELSAGGYPDLLGWDRLPGGGLVTRISKLNDFLGDFVSTVESRGVGLIRIASWHSGSR